MPLLGRRVVGLLAVLVLIASASPARADPGDVYREFRNTGALTCTHTRADLQDLVGNATVYQYADQAVLARLTPAARRALADGCYVGGKRAGTATAANTGLSPKRIAAIVVSLGVLFGIGGLVLRRRRDDRVGMALVAVPPVALVVAAAWLARGGGGVASITWLPFTIALAACVVALAAVGAVPAVRRPTALAIGAALLLALWSGVSLVWTAAPGAGELATVRAGLWALAFVVGATFAARAAGAWSALAAVVATAGVVAVTVVVRLLGGGGAMFRFGRLAWPIDYTNATAALVCLGVPAVVVVAARPGLARRWQAAAGGLASLLIATVLLSQSRGAAAALAVAIVVVVAFRGWRAVGAVLAAVAPIAVQLPAIAHAPVATAGARHELGVRVIIVTVAAALLAPPLVALGARAGAVVTGARPRVPRRFLIGLTVLLVLIVAVAGAGSVQARWAEFSAPAHVGHSSASSRFGSVSTNRYEYWAIATRAALAHPVEGIGAGAYSVAWFAHRSYPESVNDAHSFLFGTAAELGLMGLVLVLAVIALPARARARSELSTALLATSAFAIVHAATDWNLTIPALAIPAFVILGAGTASPAGGTRLEFASRSMRIALVLFGLAVMAFAAPVAVGAWRTVTGDAVTATDPQQALAYYARAAWWDRLSASPLIAASTLAVNSTDWRRTYKLAQQAVDREPQSWVAWDTLRNAALRTGDTATVAQAQRRELALNPLADLGNLDAPLGFPAHQPSKCLTTSNLAGPGGATTFAELASLGVRTWVRPLSWYETARTRPVRPRDPSDPAYRWSPEIDAEVATAVRNGIEPVLYLTATPHWASGKTSPTWAPTSPADFADFAVAAMKHYPAVRRWMIWSEPNRNRTFRPQGDNGRAAPRLYARILDATYGAMHAARSDVVVIGANLAPRGYDDSGTTTPDTFLANMLLPDGRPPRLDLLGINPYSERRPDIALPHFPASVDINDLDWLVRRADEIWPGQRVNLFISEFGWLTEPGNTGWLFRVSRAQQAADLPAAYRLAANLGRVDTMCWFLLRDAHFPVKNPAPGHAPFYIWTSGLELADGTHKPSYDVFRSVPSGPGQLR